MFMKKTWDKFTQPSFQNFENEKRSRISKKEHGKTWFNQTCGFSLIALNPILSLKMQGEWKIQMIFFYLIFYKLLTSTALRSPGIFNKANPLEPALILICALGTH